MTSYCNLLQKIIIHAPTTDPDSSFRWILFTWFAVRHTTSNDVVAFSCAQRMQITRILLCCVRRTYNLVLQLPIFRVEKAIAFS